MIPDSRFRVPKPLHPNHLPPGAREQVAAIRGLRNSIVCLCVVLALAAACLAQAPSLRKRPVVLVFDLNTGSGADKDFADQATQELKTFVRETNRVDAVRYDPASPVVERAVIEKTLKREEADSPTTPEMRARLAGLFGVQYFTGGDLAVSQGNVDLTLALTEVDGGRKWVSQQRVAAASVEGGDPKRDLGNARASAVRTAVSQIAQEAFAGLPVGPPETVPTEIIPSAIEPVGNLDQRVLADRMARADRYAKDGNFAGAISELKRVINADPKLIEPRLKLADLYQRQRKYDQAIDELKRARELAPASKEILKALAAAYEAQGDLDEAAKLYKDLPPDEEPATAAARKLALGDLYWKSARIEDAVAEYRAAAEADPKDPKPHVRLARVLAAKAQFSDSAKEVQAARKLTPEGSPVIDHEAFQGFLKVVDSEIRAVYAQYQVGDAAFQAHDRTREEYHDAVHGLGERAAALAGFLDTLPTPEQFRASKRHRVLGLTLFSQGTASLMTFLETDDDGEREQSALCFAEAVKEFQTAFSLDRKLIEKTAK